MLLSILLFLVPLGGIIYIYIQWLSKNSEDSQYYLAPLWILFTCLLLGALSQKQVFTQATVESYSERRGNGWFNEDDPIHYEPNYAGEDIPVKTLGLAPLIGLVILLLLLPHTQRKTQAIHFITLMVLVYPWGCVMVLSEIGDRPKLFKDRRELPAIGTRVPMQPVQPPY